MEERQASLRAELETAGAAKAQREEAITLATQLARELRAGLDRLAQDIADAQSAARAWRKERARRRRKRRGCGRRRRIFTTASPG